MQHKRVIEKRDRQFFDAFLILVGIFVGMIAGILLLGDLVGDGQREEEAEQAAVEERIAPVGQVALIGDASLATAPAAAAPQQAVPAPAAPAQAPAAASMSGAEIYNQVCAVCHVPGLMGAPTLTDPAGWEARIAQGTDVLEDHVINGFQGQAGVMPPKGGRTDLSDEQVLAALQFMLENVQ